MFGKEQSQAAGCGCRAVGLPELRRLHRRRRSRVQHLTASALHWVGSSESQCCQWHAAISLEMELPYQNKHIPTMSFIPAMALGNST